MRNRPTNCLRHCPTIVPALVAILVGAPSASAGLVTLQVDSARSNISLEATFRNIFGELLPLEGQGPGTLSTHFSGTAQLDLGSGSIALQILADAADQVGSYLPGRPSQPLFTLSPADLAGRVNNPDPNVQLLFAARNWSLSLASLPTPIDPAGQFSVSNVLAVLEWEQSYFMGSLEGSGLRGGHPPSPQVQSNVATLPGSFQQVGDEYVLTVPFEVPWTIGVFIQTLEPVSGRLHGQFVAVAPVPEMGSLWLVIAAVTLLGYRISRRPAAAVRAG